MRGEALQCITGVALSAILLKWPLCYSKRRISVPAFSILVLCCFITGVLIERRINYRELLHKILTVCTVAAAQLMLTVQILSLYYGLTPIRLLLMNITLSCIIFILLRNRPFGEDFAWSMLVKEFLVHLREIFRSDMTVKVMLSISLLTAVIFILFSIMLHPIGDKYHFEMPLFWMQYQSILPFPIHNPRITSFAFLSEILCIPGFMYLKTTFLNAVYTWFCLIILIWIIYKIARRFNFKETASLFSALLINGYILILIQMTCGKFDLFISSIWVSGGILFLLDAYDASSESGAYAKYAGMSLFLFIMALGVKNVLTLSVIPFLLCMWILMNRKVLDWEIWLKFVFIGILGVLCSGFLWNYVSNYFWFGDIRGPKEILEHTASLSVVAVYTRLMRGLTFLIDFGYLPGGLQEIYSNIIIWLLDKSGATPLLPGEGFYFNYTPKKELAHGLGLLGTFVLIPSLIIAFVKCFSVRWFKKTVSSSCDDNTKRLSVIVFISSSFILYHVFLKWQATGFLRLMMPIIIVCLPFTAIVLKRKLGRVVVILLYLMSISTVLMVFLIQNLFYWETGPLGHVLEPIASISRPAYRPTIDMESHGKAESFLLKGYPSTKEVYSRMMSGIKGPVTIGFVGSSLVDDNVYLLFGNEFENRVLPIVEHADKANLLKILNEADYIVHDGSRRDISEVLSNVASLPCFRAVSEGRTLLEAFKIKK